MIRVAAIHFGKSNDAQENSHRLLSLNRQAASGGAKVIVNPELPTIPLFGAAAPIVCPDHERTPSPEESIVALVAAQSLAEGHCALLVNQLRQEIAQPYGATVIVAVFTREGGRVRNSALVIRAEGVVGRYDKRVLTSESHYVTVGTTSFGPVGGDAAIGAAVCGDYWRLRSGDVLPSLAGAGCRLIAIPASIDGATTPTLQGHSLGAAIVLANSFEYEYAHFAPPQSCVVDASGDVLRQCSAARDEVMIAEVTA